MSSLAVGLERISQVVGYQLTTGNFNETTPNLPQRLVIIGEGNTANQATMLEVAKEYTSAQAVGNDFGFGSPLYTMMRILRPLNGGGIGGIPTIIIAQKAAAGATSKQVEIVPSGIATGNGTHFVIIAGRDGVDGTSYAINVSEGDTTDLLTQKIEDAINAVLGSPVLATSNDYTATLETKWKGLSANDLNVSVNVGDNSLGLTYTVNTLQAGSATPSIASALAQFGNNWNTVVLNSYGAVPTIMSALEAFNGIPDAAIPTGRYTAIIFKPFIAITGSTLDDPTSITDSRKLDVTISIAPAPLSKGFQFEAAANMSVLYCRVAQDNPHLDVSSLYYSDMPTPVSIGSMASYDNRDLFVKKGCSTVDLNNGKYQVMDFVTTFHPDGDLIPQFRFVRNLNIDLNIRFAYFLREQIAVIGHVIANDNDIVEANNVIKPKMWKQELFDLSEDLAKRALIVDAAFMQTNTVVNISTVNPDRFESFFKYKRSGFDRVNSTTVQAGFNFGKV